MKQALLITAYKDFTSLYHLIKFFPDESFNIYIHYDKKSILSTKEKSFLKTNYNYFVSRKYAVNWGGRNHLLAILHLAEKASLNPENSFFHLITGQDLPVKPIPYFLNKLDTTKDYLQTVMYPVSYLPGGAKDWFEYYLPYDHINAKKHLKYIRMIKNIQIRLGIKRNFNQYFKQNYYGSTYWSLTRPTLEYVVRYTKTNPGFLKRLKFTFCAEEIYFSTVIMNSPSAPHVVNNNLRFIKWENNGRGGSPKVLDTSDFDEIAQSNALFARKFEPALIEQVLNRFYF